MREVQFPRGWNVVVVVVHVLFLVTVPDQHRFRSRLVYRNVAPSAVVVIMLSMYLALVGIYIYVYLTLVRLQGKAKRNPQIDSISIIRYACYDRLIK